MSERNSGGSGHAKPAQASFGAFVRKPVERVEDKQAEDKVSAETGSKAAEMRVESAESWPADAVEVGAMVDAYGLKGWVKV
ncbi:MAG: rRNA processing protein RimM, partial [Paraburkholderia sp.]|nr:rRNA processing protein RimM [Paraburkholderia sp.]